MKITPLSLLLMVHMAVAGATEWREHSGIFATFRTPASMKPNPNKIGGDSIAEVFESGEISLVFDSEAPTLPRPLQKQLERTVEAWVDQRKNNWAESIYLQNGGAISGCKGEKNPEGMPFYLYLGFAVEEDMTFAIHIRFRKLDALDDIERILKSIKLKTPKNYKPLKPPRDPSIIPGLDPLPENK